METLKNLLRPGNADDNQTLYGQNNPANTADTSHSRSGLTGEGSHLSGSHGQTNIEGQGSSTATGTHAHHTRGLTGEGSHLTANKESTNLLGEHQQHPLGQGSHDSSSISRNMNTNTSTQHAEGLSGQGSHLGSSNQTTHLPGQDVNNPLSTGRGHGLSQPGQQQYPINTGPGDSNIHSGTTNAPHSSNLLNKIDPRVDTSQSHTTTSGDHTGRNLGLAAGAGGIASQAYDSSRGDTTFGSSGTHAKSTDGPHQSDLLNKADPRIDSDNSRDINTGAGAADYSSKSGVHNAGTMGSGSTGPHQTGAANLLDPSMNRGSNVGTEDAIHHHEIYGGGAEEADHHHRDGETQAAGAGAVGLGAIGMGSQSHQSRFTERGADEYGTGNQSAMPGAYPPETPPVAGGTYQPGSTEYSSQGAGIPDRTLATNEPTSSTGDKEHHYGRDAAIVGGAAGLGGAAYGASKHSDDKTSEPVYHSDALNRADPRANTQSSAPGIGGNLQDRSHDIMTGGDTSHQSSTSTPHAASTLNRGDQTIGSDSSKEHHYGRDAAIGAGAAGAGYGLGRQHESEPQHASVQPTTTQHTSDPVSRTGNTTDTDRSKEHHYGRDAAIGAGVAGAGYGLGRQHDSHPQGVSTTTTTHPTTTTTTTTSTSSTGPDPSLIINRGHPRVEADRPHGNDNDLINRGHPRSEQDRALEKEKDHHYGRDAALAGGGVGAAAYGAHKYNERDDKEALKQAEKDQKHAEKEQHHAQKEHDKAVHKQEKEQHHAQKEHEKAVHKQEKEDKQHHKAVLAAEKEHKHAEKEQHQAQKEHDKDAKQHDKAILAAEKERKHKEKEHEKQLRDNDKHDIKDEKHAEKKEHKGLFSFLHRDKNKKYTKDEEDEFDRQEKDHNARNLAGGAAVAGAGTYAAHQHHSGHHDSSHSGSTQAADQGKGHTPLVDHPPSSSIGDKLHGVARNRGIESGTGYPDGGAPKDHINHHTGERLDDAGVTGHSHDGQRKPSLGERLHGHDRFSGVPSSTGYPEGGAPKDSINHHTGEKLAAGTAAGAGAGVLGHEHNASQQHGTHGYQSGGTSSGIGASTLGHGHDTTQQHGNDRSSHTGEKLAAGTAAGAGAGALGHEHNTSQQHGSDVGNTGYGTNTRSNVTDITHGRSTDDSYPQSGSNVTSPTSAQYTHSQSTTDPSSSHHDSSSAAPRHLTSDNNQSSSYQDSGSAAPRHLTSEQKLDHKGEGVLDSGSGVKTEQGVAAGESQDTVGTGGRNRLHKEMPAKIAAERNL